MYSSTNGTSSGIQDVTVVDIRSDTLSKPTPQMMEAMMKADLGDDVYEEDPTIKKLESDVAKLFDKEASLFVPSGTMGNLIGIMIHCNARGTEAITGDMAHTFLYEQAGAAYLGGVQLNLIPNNPDGTFCLKTLKRKIRGFDFHEPKTQLVLVENTHNMCGGKVLPLSFLSDLSVLAKENNLAVHMDGARIFNAAAFLQVPVSEIVKYVDSVCFCLSKGLSCPVGSMLVGTTDFIKEARRLRKALGGGMRQTGLLAAAGLVAIDEIVPKLKLDHAKALKVAQVIENMKSPIFKVDLPNVQTNILMVELRDTAITAVDFAKRLILVTEGEIKAGITDQDGKGISVKVSSRDWAFARFVFYHQITEPQVDLLIKKVAYVVREYDGQK